jgi:hypothetical protein
MSTDTFEDQLRSLLHGSADAEGSAYLDVAPYAVVYTGRRIIRRRRVAAGAGIAAATAVVGLVGWSVLGSGVDRASLPAGPAHSTTSSATAGDHGTTALLDELSDLSGPQGQPVDVPGPRRLAVTIDAGRTPDLVYSAVASDGSLTMMGGSSLVGVDRLASTWGTAGEGSHVLVGVLPEQAEQFQLVTPVTDEGGHASTSVTAPIPGTGRQAFAVRFAEAGDADAVRHLLWWDGDAVVHDESGAVVPSVVLGDADGTVMFVSEALDRMGTFSTRDGLTSMELDGSRNSSGRPVISSGRGDGDRVDWLFAAVVPATAEPGTITPSDGSSVATPLAKVAVPGTDRAVIWSRLSSPKDEKGSGYVSATWTEDGRTVTQRP